MSEAFRAETASTVRTEAVTASVGVATEVRHARAQDQYRIQFALKRVLDLVLTALALVVLAIPVILIVIAIKLDSSGPMLFTQKRVGFAGKPFTIYKFRSMVVDAELMRGSVNGRNETDGPLFKMQQDPRMTRVGPFLRRFSLDEIPQLINVLLGNMSLVGPRPFLAAETENHDRWHQVRATAVPGMTGLWQVSGRSELPFEQIVALDIRYVEEWSLLMDIKIVLRTIPAVLIGRGAY